MPNSTPREPGDSAVVREVRIREEHDGPDSRYLTAYLEPNGDLRVEGQDLGPGTAIVSSDGEYEWGYVVDRSHLPALVSALEGVEGQDLLILIRDKWTGARAGEFEKRVRESGIALKDQWTWS